MVIRFIIPGTPFNDEITFLSTAFAYDIFGGDGNDILNGGNLSDVISGGNGNDTLFGGGGNDTLFGEAGNDILRGGSGNDALSGGGGQDTFIGGSGRDVMTGGSSGDTFVFGSIVESSAGAAKDVITDFVRGSDTINIDMIDASTLSSGDQDFSFIGSQGFTAGVAGQVRAEVFLSSDGIGVTIVRADINGDRVSDFEIQLTGTYALASSDFDL